MNTNDLPTGIQLTEGRGGLPCLRIDTPLAEAEVYLHGAHVTHFQPRGQHPFLYLCAKSFFETGKPIRGGVPICYPWFSARAGGLSGPMHGLARLQSWQLEEARVTPDGAAELVFHFVPDAASLAQWPHAAEARYRVRFGANLHLAFEVRNPSNSPLDYEAALHTYLAVGDVREVWLEGLAGTRFFGHTHLKEERVEPAEPLRFTGETDRLYLDTTATCTVYDPVWKRRLIVEKTASRNTVVWNPWIARAAALADMDDHEWPGMLCVETCNVRNNRIALAPGASHTMTATIRAEPLP